MDGSGKSSASEAIEAHLRERGIPVKVNWHRLGEMKALDLVARPVKRVLRPRRPVADPLASGRPEHPGARRRRGPIAWTWTLLVALVSVRDELISCGLTSRGIAVICDRWTCDALVDLELRYGGHRPAAWLLRRATPPADVELLLEIDAETAARRKPGDQPLAVLDRMPALYERAARSTGARRIDAARPQSEVLEAVRAAVDNALALRRV
jgi:thymidylate kinase